MYLKKIELQGFKSFPEKIRLEFGRGITAVVGPNGSGKSNIADAVRWVLGEQSAKSLRGSKMEDIIFAGTANRRQLGFAEVTLVIDNTDNRLPIGFSEVSVTRRVFRSGESEYRINGSACRLKDIHEMFMDTGIGKEGYSIIGQGRIEEILSTRSEDRRLLFEEAAGIVKYKNRKHETEQKLERERQNLVRIEDIISELMQQLEPLREQSEVAKSYLTLKERLKLLQVNIFLLNADKTTGELDALDKNLLALAEQLAKEQAAQEKFTAEMLGLKQCIESLTREIRRCDELLSEARITAESCEGEAKLNAEKASHIALEIERLNSEADEEQSRLSALNEALESERSRRLDIELRLKQATEALLSKQQAFEDINRRMSEGEQRIESFNAQIIACLKSVSDAKSEEQRSRSAYERLEEIKEELNGDRALNKRAIMEKTEHLLELKNRQAQLEETAEKAEIVVKGLVREKDEHSGLLTENTNKLQLLQKRLNESVSRHRLLAELESGYEGYYNSVKAVLRQKHSARFKGICGAVAELLEVEQSYETAIEVALGGAAQNIVTRTEDDAIAAIDYLKERKEGRATFLPLTAIKSKDIGRQRERILSESGVCGVAKELITYAPSYENVFSSLLGRVIVVDNIHNAARLAKKYDYAYKIVTLAGELLSVGGAMTGGSSTQKVMSLFSRSREIKTLKQRIDALTKENATLEAETQAIRRQLSIIKEQLEEKRKLLQETALERAALAQSINQTSEVVHTLEREEAELAEKDAQLMERLIDANKQARAHVTLIAERERELESLHKQLDAFQSAMLTEKEEKEEGIRELVNAKSEVSALEQNAHASQSNIERMELEAAGAKEVIDKHHAGIKAQLAQRARLEEMLAGIVKRTESLKTRQAELESELTSLNAQRSEKAEGLTRLENLERETLSALSGLRAENVRLEMKKEQVAENNRRLYDEMWEEYGITYQTAVKYERLGLSEAQLARDERGIKAEIHALGDVNVGAIEEYRSVKTRFEFLSGQRDDIIAAEDKLRQIIGELTEHMERQFTEQFKLISENFSYVFSEMFGGGKAYLKLLDEGNVLDTGIDIVAQPPGKNLQSMSLLSGGERALTATALLFGILRMKPSPFCILDEVEAALDDSNVIRYANYLKNFSGETQFILVTHRKGTMEAADTLYGVTMQEQGVSKLVSVKLTE